MPLSAGITDPTVWDLLRKLRARYDSFGVQPWCRKRAPTSEILRYGWMPSSEPPSDSEDDEEDKENRPHPPIPALTVPAAPQNRPPIVLPAAPSSPEITIVREVTMVHDDMSDLDLLETQGYIMLE